MLPKDVENIILEYSYGLEHYEKLRPVMVELFMFGVIHRPYWLHTISYFLVFQ